MQLTGKIDAITAPQSGISQITGRPWKACSLVLKCTENVYGNDVQNLFLLRCRDKACEQVQEIAKTADIAGNIEGIYKCTCFSTVRTLRSKLGTEYEKQEINMFEIVRIDTEEMEVNNERSY